MLSQLSNRTTAAGIDQTRGWFYSLMVISTILFDKPAFKNLVCNGMVLAEDGKKMSKSLKNYPVRDPAHTANRMFQLAQEEYELAL